MEITLQDHLQPENILAALTKAADPSLTNLSMGVAYATLAGSTLLASRLSKDLGLTKWNSTRKFLITCFDHGTTEPAALRYWSACPNTEVRIYHADLLETQSLIPSKAFHTKVYYFQKSQQSSLIVGSANLTQRALTTNVEAITRVDANDENTSLVFAKIWDRLWVESIQVSESLIQQYEELRSRLPIPRIDPPIPPPPATPRLLTLWELIETGVQPQNYKNMWIQAGAMTGGSRNQLELPRGSHSFFNFTFNRYGDRDVAIGTPMLRSGPYLWTDRAVSWKGDNQMERLNLPTLATGGFDYVHKAVLFRRLDSGDYEIIVDDWDSDVSNAWRTASTEKGNLFKLGANSARVCGFF